MQVSATTSKGASSRLPGSSAHRVSNAALRSFSLPSEPNTATASCSLSSVARWTLISVL